MILPEHLVDQVASIKDETDRGSPSLEQLSFADFLARGEFDHHFRRMRPIYRARHDTLLGAFRRYLPEVRPVGASAGLHVVAWLPDDIDEAVLIARAASVGVALTGVTPYRRIPANGPGSLIFGYGMPTETEIDEGVRLIARELAAMRRAA